MRQCTICGRQNENPCSLDPLDRELPACKPGDWGAKPLLVKLVVGVILAIAAVLAVTQLTGCGGKDGFAGGRLGTSEDVTALQTQLDASKASLDRAVAEGKIKAEEAADAQKALAQAQAMLDLVKGAQGPDGSVELGGLLTAAGQASGNPWILLGTGLAGALATMYQRRQRTADASSVAAALDFAALRSEMLNKGLTEQWAEIESKLTPAMRAAINAHVYASDLAKPSA